MGLGFSVMSHVQRPIHQTWYTEIVNKILHSQVKVISHRCEASVKGDIKVCDFCPIITPLDYIETDDVTQTNKFTMAAEEVGVESNTIEKRAMVEKRN